MGSRNSLQYQSFRSTSCRQWKYMIYQSFLISVFVCTRGKDFQQDNFYCLTYAHYLHYKLQYNMILFLTITMIIIYVDTCPDKDVLTLHKPTAKYPQRLSGEESTWRTEEPWSELSFPGHVVPVTPKLVLSQLLSQAPGIIGSAPGLVGSVSVDCNWVRASLMSNISVWQHVQLILSTQINPWDIPCL